MEEEVVRQVAPGVMMIVLVSVMFLPLAIWDSKTERYLGYLNWRAGGILLLTAAYFSYLSIRDGYDEWKFLTDIVVNLGQAVIGSRVYIELVNHSMHKKWIHRRYHRLTGHKDAPWGTVLSADAALHSPSAQPDGPHDSDEPTN